MTEIQFKDATLILHEDFSSIVDYNKLKDSYDDRSFVSFIGTILKLSENIVIPENHMDYGLPFINTKNINYVPKKMYINQKIDMQMTIKGQKINTELLYYTVDISNNVFTFTFNINNLTINTSIDHDTKILCNNNMFKYVKTDIIYDPLLASLIENVIQDKTNLENMTINNSISVDKKNIMMVKKEEIDDPLETL